MKRFLTILALWSLCVCANVSAAPETPSLTNARRAQAILGPDVWSQVITIENKGGTSRYPRTVHALVFELVGILWFYTDSEGTQSFSTHRGRLDADKADFAPLLREVSRGFASWKVVADDLVPLTPMPAGCSTVASWRASPISANASFSATMSRAPKLLSYYAGSGNHIAATRCSRMKRPLASA